MLDGRSKLRKLLGLTIENPLLLMILSFWMFRLPFLSGEQRFIPGALFLFWYLGCFVYYFFFYRFSRLYPNGGPKRRRGVPKVIVVNFTKHEPVVTRKAA